MHLLGKLRKCLEAGPVKDAVKKYNFQENPLDSEFIFGGADTFRKLIPEFDHKAKKFTEIKGCNNYSSRKLIEMAVDHENEIHKYFDFDCEKELRDGLLTAYIISKIFKFVDGEILELVKKNGQYFLRDEESDFNLMEYICNKFEASDKEALIDLIELN